MSDKAEVIEVDPGSGTVKVGVSEDTFIRVNLRDVPARVKIELAQREMGRRLRTAWNRKGQSAAGQVVEAWLKGYTDPQEARRASRKPPVIVEALSRVWGISVEEAEREWRSRSRGQRKELLKDRHVKAERLKVSAGRLEEEV